MHPYQYRKLTAAADVADIKNEARSSQSGKNYNRNVAKKAATRRALKRQDKARARREWMTE